MEGFPKRGEIFWVDLEPAIGSETKKIRPGLIISNDMGNQASNVVIIAPITSKSQRVFPFEVAITMDNKKAKIMLNQCRAIDKSRLKKSIMMVPQTIMEKVDEAIRLVFDLEK